MVEARKIWAQDKRRNSGDANLREQLRQVRNAYYYIHQAKRQCWQNFLQRLDNNSQPKTNLINENHCWMALKYTKPRQFKMTPALKDVEGNIATSMNAKEALVRTSAFSKPPTNGTAEPVVTSGTAHKEVTEKVIEKALMTQSTSKAPGPDKFNFRILRMVWQWDSKQIIAIVQNAIRLGHHQPRRWNKAQGILLEKGGKRDLSLVKSYRVISLLNCMGKIVGKVVAGQFSHYFEKFSKLHPEQMGARKERCAIDAVTL